MKTLTVFLRGAAFALAILASSGSASRAQIVAKQWQKLLANDIDSVEIVSFFPHSGAPVVGLAGCKHGIYRSSDTGSTWVKMLDEPSSDITDFAFKDTLNGWASSNGPIACYRTTDGGSSWRALVLPVGLGEAVSYHPENNLLFLSSWDVKSAQPGSYVSTDGGDTWTSFWGSQYLNGFVFINKDSGLVTSKNFVYLRTTDGGMNWNPINRTGSESWQPLADSSNGIIYAPGEIDLNIYASRDFGNTFTALPVQIPTVGTFQLASCGKILAQCGSDRNNVASGFLESTDQGQSWLPIGGPSNHLDSRFYSRGSYIFAGSYDKATKSGNIWRYVGDAALYGTMDQRPQESTNSLTIVAPQCGSFDTTLSILFHNDCSTATLVDARLKASNHFRLAIPDALPFSFHGQYAIPIWFVPVAHQSEHATLNLIYDVLGTKYYDSVQIDASVSGSAAGVHFDMTVDGAKVATVRAGDSTVLSLRSIAGIPASLGVDSVMFQFSFDRNILELKKFDPAPPWSIWRESHTDSSETIVLRHAHGGDIAAATDLATFLYGVTLSTNEATFVHLDSMRLNDGDLLFSPCEVFSELPVDPLVRVTPECGDSIFRTAMRDANDLELLSVQQAGARAEIRVRARDAIETTLSISNVLGKVLKVTRISIGRGDQTIEESLTGLAEGSYFVTVHAGMQSHTKRFVLKR